MFATMKWGFLNIHKPLRMTSRDVVSKIERAVRPLKVGHAGTLDPLAEGVLVIGIGPATRLTEHVQALPKGYSATFHLGQTTETDDAEGRLSPQVDTQHLTRELIEQELTHFCGQIQQIPPRFSAVHVAGKRAYDLARSGQDFELTPKTVEVHQIALTKHANPDIELQIECGSGTYIRSLARDLGEKLQCGAYMSALTRTHIGPFHLDSALRLDSLPNGFSLADLQPLLLHPMLAFTESQRWVATRQAVVDLQHGKNISGDALQALHSTAESQPEIPAHACILNEDREVIAVAEFCPQTKLLRPRIGIPKHFLEAHSC